MAQGKGIDILLPFGENSVGAERHLVGFGQFVIPPHPLGGLGGMQIAKVIYPFSLQVLVSFVGLLTDVAGLHLQVYLCPILNSTVYIKALRLFLRVAGRYLVAANLHVSNLTPDDGGNQIHQHRLGF